MKELVASRLRELPLGDGSAIGGGVDGQRAAAEHGEAVAEAPELGCREELRRIVEPAREAPVRRGDGGLPAQRCAEGVQAQRAGEPASSRELGGNGQHAPVAVAEEGIGARLVHARSGRAAGCRRREPARPPREGAFTRGPGARRRGARRDTVTAMRMSALRAPERRELYGAGAALVVVVALGLALLPLRDDVDPGTIALVLLAVPLTASLGGRRVALLGAAAGALAFNYLFTRPYGTLRIATDEDVAALVVYAGVGVALAVAIDRLRAARDLASFRAAGATLLRDVTEDLLRSEHAATALARAVARLHEHLRLDGLALHVDLPSGACDASAGSAARALAALADAEAAGAVRRIQVATSDRVYGVLAIDAGAGLGPEGARVVEAFVGVAALAAAREGYEQERVARRAVEQSDRLRAALLQSVTHDLRTPLTAIRAGASALAAGEADPRRRELLDDLDREAARLARLVDDMLDLSRIESGQLRPRLEPLPVDDLVAEAVDAVRFALAGRDLHVDVPEDVPPVAGDETMLRQVLVNLLENAAAHAPSGRIEVRAASGDGAIELVVADHGDGIPEVERQRVFEPYRRLGGAGRPSGSGLGLAIARGLVAAHAGTIRAEATPGGGATIVVRLPAAQVAP